MGLLAGMTESACTPYGVGQLVNFHEFYCRNGLEHHLGNAFIALNREWLLSQIQQRPSLLRDNRHQSYLENSGR